MGHRSGMSRDDCIFCKMAAGEIPVSRVFEDDAVLAFLDINPVSDGHTLVIPKEHCATVGDCPPEVLGSVGSRLGEIARAVSEATGSDGYNVLCNNYRAAGQLVEHVHFHIIPRRIGDGVFNRWPSYQYGKGQADAIAAAIREKL